MNDDADDSRRSFLLSSGGLLTAAWVGTQWASISAAAHDVADMAAADVAQAPAWTGYQFLTPAEAADVDAIAAQIVPSGPTPGAREAHAVYFLDRALATFFAAQAEEFRDGLSDFQAKFLAGVGGTAAGSFAAAESAEQIGFLRMVDHTPFFDAVRTLTLLGMFSSPKYGGNFQGSGWKMIGFEDRHVFAPPFGYYDARYTGFVPYAGTKPG